MSREKWPGLSPGTGIIRLMDNKSPPAGTRKRLEIYLKSWTSIEKGFFELQTAWQIRLACLRTVSGRDDLRRGLGLGREQGRIQVHVRPVCEGRGQFHRYRRRLHRRYQRKNGR